MKVSFDFLKIKLSNNLITINNNEGKKTKLNMSNCSLFLNQIVIDSFKRIIYLVYKLFLNNKNLIVQNKLHFHQAKDGRKH